MPPGRIVDFNPDDAKLQYLLEALEAKGYIKSYIDGSAEITQSGILALAEAEKANSTEQQRQENIIREQATAQRAEDERRILEQRKNHLHDWLVGIFAAIIAGLVVLAVNQLITR